MVMLLGVCRRCPGGSCMFLYNKDRYSNITILVVCRYEQAADDSRGDVVNVVNYHDVETSSL